MPPTTRPCWTSCARWASATGAHPARIEVVPTRDHWEARWVAPHVDARTRLGAPARQRPQRTLLRRIADSAHVRALPRVAIRGGDLLCRPARRAAGLLGAGARPGCCAAARAFATCAKSGARALAPVRGARRRGRWPQAPAVLRASAATPSRYSARPGATTVRVRFTPYWALSGGQRLRAPRRATGPRCRPRGRAAARRDRLLAGADIRPRRPAAASDASSRLLADGRPRSSPAGARPAAGMAGRAAPGLPLRRRLPRLSAGARPGRGRRHRGLRPRARSDLARAHAALLRRALDPGVGLGQPRC